MKLNFKMGDLKLPSEWIQMFRILLSIYLLWLILFAPRKPLFKDNMYNKTLFVILLWLLIQTDIISSMLLLLIYFLSFQAILPISSDTEDFLNRPIPDIIDENLRRNYEYQPPTNPPIQYNFYDGLLKDKK